MLYNLPKGGFVMVIILLLLLLLQFDSTNHEIKCHSFFFVCPLMEPQER